MKKLRFGSVVIVLVGLGAACSKSTSSDESTNVAPATYEFLNSEESDPNGTLPTSTEPEPTGEPEPVENVELGRPMSLFDNRFERRGGPNALPEEVGTVTVASILFPCAAFNEPAIGVMYQPQIGVAQCPTDEGSLAFTTMTANFTYDELPRLNIADFPVQTFDASEAAYAEHNWLVGPEGTIAVLTVLTSAERVQAGVSGTSSTVYAGLATIRSGESTWTISTLAEEAWTSENPETGSYRLVNVLSDDVFLITGFASNDQDGYTAVDATGKVLWDWGTPTFHHIGRFSTIVGMGQPNNWIEGFLDSVTGNYDTVDPSYEAYDELIAFEEFYVDRTQILLYDNPGVFGVFFDSGFVRLPESSRLTAGDEGTWRVHVECDTSPFGNIRSGSIDDCNGVSRTYITPSGAPFMWDRRLVGVAGGSALFAEDYGNFYLIGPDGTETARDLTYMGSNDIAESDPDEFAFTMSDDYLLVTDGLGEATVVRMN